MTQDDDLPEEFADGSGKPQKSILTGAGAFDPGKPPGSSGKKGLLLILLLVVGGLGGGYLYLAGMEGEMAAPPVETAAVAPVAPTPAPSLDDILAAPPGAAPDAAAPVMAGQPPATPAVPGAPQEITSAPAADAMAGAVTPPLEIAAAPTIPAAEATPVALPAAMEVAATPAAVPTPTPAAAPGAAVPAPAPTAESASLLPEASGKDALPPPAALQPAGADIQLPATPAAAPTPAEMAIVQNSVMLDSMGPSTPGTPSVDKKLASAPVTGPKVTDILSEPANIRLLPEKYLVVKKDHNADDMDSRLTAARAALAQGRNGAALELFNDLYMQNPRDKRVLMGRAVSMQKLGQNGEALAAYEAALTSDPKNIEALTNMLGILKGQSQTAALEKLMQLREIYPYNADITAQLGMVYGSAGDYQNSLKYLEMADSLKPGNANILYNRAVAYDRMGHTQKAAELYRQIILLAGEEDASDRNFPFEAIKRRLAAIR